MVFFRVILKRYFRILERREIAETSLTLRRVLNVKSRVVDRASKFRGSD